MIACRSPYDQEPTYREWGECPDCGCSQVYAVPEGAYGIYICECGTEYTDDQAYGWRHD